MLAPASSLNYHRGKAAGTNTAARPNTEETMRLAIAAVATALVLQPLAAGAVELNVTHFGTGMYGVPHAIAKEKGYFKEAGLDVTGFLTSAGGGTTVRNVLASELPYGEVALPAVIAAAQQGLELT